MLKATKRKLINPGEVRELKTLTEKVNEMQEGKIKGLQQRFNYIYDKWRIQVKSAKQTSSQSTEPLSDDLLQDIVGNIIGLSADVQYIYDKLRKVSLPDQDIHRREDQCVEISKFSELRVSSRLGEKIPEEQKWPEAGSRTRWSVPLLQPICKMSDKRSKK